MLMNVDGGDDNDDDNGDGDGDGDDDDRVDILPIMQRHRHFF